MFRIALVLLTFILLIGCQEAQDSESSSPVAFAKFGATRRDVETNLKAARATVLRRSDQTLEARLDAKRLQRPMNVKLGFTHGKLASVKYWPPTLTQDLTKDTPVGRLGYRKASDEAVSPPINDHYVFFGPLGHVYFGSAGFSIQPRPALGALAILGVVFILIRRRKRIE